MSDQPEVAQPTYSELLASVQDLTTKVGWLRDAVAVTQEKHCNEVAALKERIGAIERACCEWSDSQPEAPTFAPSSIIESRDF